LPAIAVVVSRLATYASVVVPTTIIEKSASMSAAPRRDGRARRRTSRAHRRDAMGTVRVSRMTDAP
jgi:hypothetical protein